MKFQEYIYKKNQKNESQKLNEFSGDQATEVDFGLFTWGGGGEIDAMAAAAAAAGLLLAKSIYNGAVYARLTGLLPGYLKKYKLAAAPKSREVFDAKYDKEKIEPLRSKKETLLGIGGERGDEDVINVSRGDDDAEEQSPKDKIRNYFKKLIDKAPDEERKSNLREKRDKALQQLDMKVQALQNQIDKLTDKREIDWEKIQEDWRQFEEKFKQKSEGTFGFVEVRDSILASSWRKKWEKEFTIAKKNADIEVLDDALKIATENKNDKEIDAIKNAKKRAEESKKTAEDAIDEVTDEFDKAEAAQASLDELGVPAMMSANMQYNMLLGETFQKWGKLFNDLSGKKEEGGPEGPDVEGLKKKIAKAEKKIESGKKKAQQFKDAGDSERAEKVINAVKKIEKDLADYKEKLGQGNESLSDASYYNLSIQIDESIKMLDILLEEETEEKKQTLNFSEVRKTMQKAISAAPDEDKKTLATEAIADVQKIRQAKIAQADARNKMVELFKKYKEKPGDAEDRVDLPKGSEVFSNMKPIDPKEDIEPLDKAITDFKEQGGEIGKEPQETDDTESTEETPTEETPTGDGLSDEEKQRYEELIAKSEEEEEKHQKEVVEPFKADLEKEKAKDPRNEKKIAELELDVEENELQTLKLKLTTARLKAESQGKDKNEDDTYKSIMSELLDKTDALDAKKSSLQNKEEEFEESPELKDAKAELEAKEKDYTAIEGAKEMGGVSTKTDKGAQMQKDALKSVQSEIDKLKQKVEDLKNKSSEKKEESKQTNIAPKYMKFEEYMAMKNKK
jgi:hypothetical protein